MRCISRTRRTFPFENLDILLGVPIRLDFASLQAKLVTGRRGGYCFEQNALFAAALERARLRRHSPRRARASGQRRVRPRTHMTLAVDVDGKRVLADVGFGAYGLLLPVAFDDGRRARQYAWTYRIVDEGGASLLQSTCGDAWEDLYTFSDEPQHAVDYELANYYTSTHPESRFTQTLTAQQVGPEVRRILRNRIYIEDRGGEISERTLADDDEIVDRPRRRCSDCGFPSGTRFRWRGD